MINSIPPFPEYTRTIATKLTRADLIGSEGDNEISSTIKEFIEYIKKYGHEYDFIIRIFVFLEKIYEIRVFKINNKILLYTNLLKHRENIYNRFDILIELHSISHDALERYLHDYIDKYDNIIEISDIDELLVRIRLILRGVEAIDSDNKPIEITKAKEDQVDDSLISDPGSKAVEPYQLSPEELRELIRELVEIEYISITKDNTIGDVVRKFGIVAFGRGGTYVIIKINYKKCKYLVVFAVWDRKERSAKYDVKCINSYNLVKNIFERNAVKSSVVL